MIRLITGLPGAGKTYYAVKEITDLNYTFDKDYFVFKPKSKDFIIFTNIDNLKLSHISIDFYLKQHNLTIEQFFTVSYQKKLVDKYKKVVYLIDEAQKYFPKKYFNEDVLYFFQYHRHLGIDIYLITQSFYSLCPAISHLVEYEIQAIRSTNRFKHLFSYKFVASNDVIGRKYLKADKFIFSLYTSFVNDSAIKNNPRPFKKYIFIFVILVVLILFSFRLFFLNFSHSHSYTSKSVSHTAIIQKNEHKKVYVAADGDAAHARTLAHPQARTHKINYKYVPKPAKKYIVVKVGGFWNSKHKLMFINLQGHLVPVHQFPFVFVEHGFSKRISVWLPEEYFQNSVYANSYFYHNEKRQEEINGGVLSSSHSPFYPAGLVKKD